MSSLGGNTSPRRSNGTENILYILAMMEPIYLGDTLDILMRFIREYDIPGTVIKSCNRSPPFWMSNFGHVTRSRDAAEADSKTKDKSTS